MLYFLYPERLLLLGLVVLLGLVFGYVVRWKKGVIKKIGDEPLVRQQIAQYAPWKFRLRFVLFAVAIGLCVFALTGLVSPDPTQKITKSGKDIIVALDVSKSMLATDIQPDRLERAKQVIARVINAFPDDRIGLVVFAGRAYLQMPLTIDHDAARMFVATTRPEDIPTQGTDLGRALEMSMNAFDLKSKSYKMVLLVSDGEGHDPDAVKMASELAKQGIMINTVGIGSPTGSTVPDPLTGQPKTDLQGHTVISKLNEQTLSEIAATAHGTYRFYTNTDDVVNAIKAQMDKIEEMPVFTESAYLSFRQYYWYFLLGAFVLLIAEAMISERKKIRKPVIATLLLLSLCSTRSYGQSVNRMITGGNKAFKESRFEDAEKEYEAAMARQKKNSDVAGFNLGNSFYRRNQSDKAVAAYDKVIKTTKRPDIRQQAYYNKGVAYQQAQKVQESILAYKNALLLNPGDEAARQNLQRLLKQQPPQKQPEKKKEEKQNKNQKKQEQPLTQKPAKISQKEAEDKLKALLENEKALQEKMRKVAPISSNRPEKDW
ncbi:MAG: VWA domain-containing protein [Chitinophagaceae bacterium]|nr:VWA domain-containing protein [Chitinophagaceae bacterium]